MAPDIHLTRELLQALAEGKVSARFLRDQMLEHLFAFCPACREEFEAWRESRCRPARSDGYRLRLVAPGPERGSADAKEERAAQADFRELRALSPAGRIERMERATTRFQSRRLAELCLAESDRCLPDQLEEALEMAMTAQRIALRVPGCEEFAVRAAARMGNAARAMGRLPEAGTKIAFGRLLYRTLRPPTLLAAAELDRFEGSLRMDERRAAEAEELFVRARLFYDILRDRETKALVTLNLATLYYHEGELPRSMATLIDLLTTLHHRRDLALYVAAETNLACVLCDAGRYQEAGLLLGGSEADTEAADFHSQVRRLWVSARVKLATGETAPAERGLKEILQVFLDRQNAYDAALVSLDLALLYAREGRTEELREAAESLVPHFSAAQIHREAAAALRLLYEALREDGERAAVIEEVAGYLRRARRRPDLVFRPETRH